jgi:pentose-5-phosphate-3-epimerase
MADAAAKIGPAHEVFRDKPGQRPSQKEVHVDGGVNRASAALCGAAGAEVLVVGSVLWKKGHDIEREIKTIKALADEAWKRNSRLMKAGAAG